MKQELATLRILQSPLQFALNINFINFQIASYKDCKETYYVKGAFMIEHFL